MARSVISAVLTLQDQSFSAGLRRANRQAGDFGRHVQAAQNSVENFSRRAKEGLKTVGVAATALATGAIAGLGAAVGKTIFEMDDSFARLQAQTGAMGGDLEALKGAAQETFKRGYGESLQEVTNSIARVKQNMTGLDNSELANVTANALMLANTFDSDVNEVTRGANNLIQAFGISSDKAFDLFTAGGQRGLNFSNEMFDNMAEFAPLAKHMGFTAEEYFGILERGSQAGVYNLSYVNDALKEFQIMTKDGSKRTSDAMALMSKSTQDVWKSFLKGDGTVKDVASTVVAELKAMDDQVKAGQIGVELFGTKFEDLEADAVYAMLGSTDAMQDFEGATAKAAKTVEGTFGNRLKATWRDLQVSLANVVNSEKMQEFFDSMATKAENLVPVITNLTETAIPKISEMVNKVVEFGRSIKDNWSPIKETVIGITTAVIAFKVSMVALSVITGVVGFIKAYRAALAAGTVAQWAMNAAMAANPIGLVAAGIAGLIAAGVLLYRNWDTVSTKMSGAWDKIKQSAAKAVNFVIDGINALIKTINKIPGVNIPIIAKVDWGEGGAPVGFATSTLVSKPQDIRNKKTALESFAVGTNRVTKDMAANIHEGEMIIPARQSANIRAMGGNIDNIDKLVAGKSSASPVDSKANVTFGNIIIQGTGTNEGNIKEFVRQVKLQLQNT